MSFPLPLSLYHLLGIDTNKKTLMKLKMVKLGKLDLSYEILFLETNTYKRERKFGFNTTIQTVFGISGVRTLDVLFDNKKIYQLS